MANSGAIRHFDRRIFTKCRSRFHKKEFLEMPIILMYQDLGLIKQNEEVFYCPQEGIREISDTHIRFLSETAMRNPSGKCRICTHPDSHALVHEMMIAHRIDVQVPIHCHKGKEESYHIIQGSMQIELYDDSGLRKEIIPLADAGKKGVIYCRIPPNQWHTVRFLSEMTIFHEVTSGPFDRNDFLVMDPQLNQK